MFKIPPTIIKFEDKNYPPLLREIKNPPERIYVYGRVETLRGLCPVAIVGTRQITSYGQKATRKIAMELSRLGATIVSGFMYGVDITAQEAAMESGGKSIGVLGFGVDNFFPSHHEQIALKWIQRGELTLISEYPREIYPKPWTFLERNRIVAGLSKAVVVAEAAERSGSMVTARLAGDYGREVMAVPGSILSKFNEGVKNLVNQGALLVGSGEEIMQEIAGKQYRGREIGQPRELRIGERREKAAEKNEKKGGRKKVAWEREEVGELGWRIGELLKKYKAGLDIDEMQELLGEEIGELQVKLMELELGCWIKGEGKSYKRN